MKLTKQIEALRDSIRLWQYMAESGVERKSVALEAVGLSKNMRNYCPLCQAVVETVKEEGIPFTDNMRKHCIRHCPMSFRDWYRDMLDPYVVGYRVPVCETFDEGGLWKNWLNAKNKQIRQNAASDMAAAFRKKARELTDELLIEFNGDHSLASTKLAVALKLPFKNKIEYLKKHGSELCDEDIILALREVFGVKIGDTIRVSYSSVSSATIHAIPGGVERVSHSGGITATYTVSAVKSGQLYINDNTREWDGYSGSLEAGIFHFFVDVDRIEIVPPVRIVRPAVEVRQSLVDHGYTCDEEGVWRRSSRLNFLPRMWDHCGRLLANNGYGYEPEWLETKLDYISIYTKES